MKTTPLTQNPARNSIPTHAEHARLSESTQIQSLQLLRELSEKFSGQLSSFKSELTLLSKSFAEAHAGLSTRITDLEYKVNNLTRLLSNIPPRPPH
jgi:archaellum component FlaC